MEKSEDSANLIQQELKKLLDLPPETLATLRVEETLLLLAKQIATVRRSAHYIEQLNLLRDVANKLVEIRDLDQLARHLLEGANKLIPFTDGSIGLVNGGYITFPYAIGASADSVLSFKIPVGEGLTGWVVQNKQSVRLGDISKDRRYRDQIKATRSEMDVPIIYGGESIGVINIESTQVNAFSEDDERLITALSEHAAIAFKNAQLFNQLNGLAEIAQQLSSTLDDKIILDQILEKVSKLINCPEVSVGILKLETNTLQFTQAKGPSSEDVLQYSASIEEGLAGLAVRTMKPVRVDDVTKHPKYQAQISTTKSELDVPLLIGNQVIGVLNAESPDIGAFSEDDEYLLVTVASHAALAIRNAKLYQEIREELESMLIRQEAAEKMAFIGDVAGNLVHRMNNDVGAIRVRASQISEQAENESIQIKAQLINDLANKVLNQFREFRERYKEVESIPLEINPIIDAAIQDVQIPPGIKLTKEFGINLKKSYGSEGHLKEVFRNLVTNAVEAMPGGGDLIINSQLNGKNNLIRVLDSGEGISEKDAPYVFTLGFSTKSEGKGLGYGLFWVKTYLNRIGGQIELEKSEKGVGSIFTIILPTLED